jgi:hypothetical protein
VKELSVARIRLASPLVSLLAVVGFAARVMAVQPSEMLLPATTKGFVSTHDVDEVRNKFNETQLGEMVADPVMKPFIDDFKKQIGQKLEKAGKKLGIRWDDLEGVYGGEVALALIQPDPKDKMSHATVLIVDITGKKAEAQKLLAKVDANQRANRAKRTTIKGGGVEMTVYTQLRKEGEKFDEQSFHFIRDDQLVVSDHLPTATAIAGRFDGKAKDTLASIPAFEYTMQRSTKEAGGIHHHVRWFVEPFGYAEAARAAQGGKKKRGQDLLKIVQSQGFTAIQGIGGYVFFATSDVEVLHRTYVYSPAVKRAPGDERKDRYNLAMRMLDFPNSKTPTDLDPPPWVLSDVATYLGFNWKMKEAFDYSETLVDAIAGDKGVFKEIWLSLKSDPNGPKIDIYKGLVNLLGTRAHLLSDVRVPVGLKSERMMGVIEVKDAATVAKTVEQAFKNDPQAKKRIFRGHTIWEITQEEGVAEESSELMIEGAGFVATTEAAPKKEDKPKDDDKKLPNMAITVYKSYLVVGTHVDFIEELIKRGEDPTNLIKMQDFQRVHDALIKLGAKNDSVRFFSRTDESYRATYELLKQGKLPEAETMLARLLNAMFAPAEEGAVRKQEIDGSKLPDFDQVKKYLGPGGVYAQSEDDGWWVVGCLLKKQAADAAANPAAPAEKENPAAAPAEKEKPAATTSEKKAAGTEEDSTDTQ